MTNAEEGILNWLGQHRKIQWRGQDFTRT